MSNPTREFERVEIVKGEVGEPVHIETPQGCFTATWLGTVSNGKELAEAMRLVCAIASERKVEAEAV